MLKTPVPDSPAPCGGTVQLGAILRRGTISGENSLHRMNTSAESPHLFRLRRIAGLALLLLACAGLCLHAQEEEQAPESSAPQSEQPAATQPATTAQNTTVRLSVRGMVRSGSQAVARALVRIEGDATTGALTDGDGRFEIPDVPAGPQIFTVLKPGYQDLPFGAAIQTSSNEGVSHNVQVTATMPELVFNLAPTAALHGFVRNDSGEALAGVSIFLVQRAVQDGRAVWRMRGNPVLHAQDNNVKTRADGSFRFAGLSEGDYMLFTLPLLEKDRVPGEDSDGANNSGQQFKAEPGYPGLYYPGVRTPSGATRIALAAGEDQEATIVLPREIFEPVTTRLLTASGAGKLDGDFDAQLLDSEGNPLPYAARYVKDKQQIEALLPGGNYTLRVSSGPQSRGSFWMGELTLGVEAHPLSTSLALLPTRFQPVEVSVQHGATLPQGGVGGNLLLLAMPAAGFLGDMVSEYAAGAYPGPLPVSPMPSGQFWLQSSPSARGLCEVSLTAGGVNMAREPVRIAPGSGTPPIQLALRDDCAHLTLQLPGLPATTQGGEEPYYTAYIVPDFDSTSNILPVTLRPSNDGAATVDRLTPGSYRVYVFPGPYALEYRNADALAALSTKPQNITLGPGEDRQLVVEVPEP